MALDGADSAAAAGALAGDFLEEPGSVLALFLEPASLRAAASSSNSGARFRAFGRAGRASGGADGDGPTLGGRRRLVTSGCLSASSEGSLSPSWLLESEEPSLSLSFSSDGSPSLASAATAPP